MDPSPFGRHTFWTVFISGLVGQLGTWGPNQAIYQKYRNLPTLKDAIKTTWFQMPFHFLIDLILGLVSLITVAYYLKCDPLKTERISSSDQILPLFVEDTTGHLSGVPGLFVAAMFAGALSLVSIATVAITMYCLEDLVRPHILKSMTKRQEYWLFKIIGEYIKS